MRIPFTEQELREFVDMIPNGEKKRGLLAKLRDKLPEVPKWLTFEEHVKTAEMYVKNDLIPGVTPANQQQVDNQGEKQPA